MNTLPQPSIKTLVLSCLFSTLLALVILLIAVLPAEFNIDPTGLGKAMGLTVLAPSQDSSPQPAIITCPEVQAAPPITADKATDPAGQKAADHNPWQDAVFIKVPAHKGLEYKFHLIKGETLEFVWNTDGAALYFDFHGEPAGDKTGYFKSFKEATQNQSSGTLTVPFTGSHGWYWKNTSNKEVIINLQTRGNYRVIGFP